MSRLLASERVAALANLLEHVAVSNLGFNHFDTSGLHCQLEPEVAHHRGDQGVAGQVAALFEAQGHDCHDLVAIDNLAGVIDGEATVCVAIVCDAEVGVVLEHC